MSREKPVEFTLKPVVPAGFVGRRAEIGELLSRARQPIPPLQSLEGPSKIGRTSMLRYLRAISRREVAHPLFEPSREDLIAPYIDLTLHPYREVTAEQAILEAIAAEIGARGLPAPTPTQGPAAMAKVATRMAELTASGHSFLLLVDHVEHLLVRADEPEREAWSSRATAALGELNERVQVAVLLAFGATGPARGLRAKARSLQMLETLEALSQILNRGNATRTALGPLEDAEVHAFAERAKRPGPAGKTRRLNVEEVEWIVDLAGGHPLVMQNAGVRLAEAASSGGAKERRAELERQLADPGLQGFLIDAFRRIGPLDEASAAKLEGLAEGEAVELDPELAVGLEEEGLIRASDRSSAVTMPSRGLRMALLAYLAARDAAESIPPAEGDFRAQPSVASPVLALRGDKSRPALRLTRSEHALMKVLLGAGKAGSASRGDLKAALGPNTGDPQLTQRVSVLRKKISRTLGVVDAIEGLYGEGYRLNEPQWYVLRDHP